MSRLRSFACAIRDAITVITFSLLIAGIIGQLANDRYAALAPLMYLPVPMIALLTLMIDIARRGRTLRGIRFTFSFIAILSLTIESRTLFGFGSFDTPDQSGSTVRLLQWNIEWGGSFSRASGWDETCKKILDRKPDIIVLSEVPLDESRPQSLMQKLGDGWTEIPFNYYGPDGYISRMRLICKYNSQIEQTFSNSAGTVAIARIDSPTPIRLLLVDGVSGMNDKFVFYQLIEDAVKQGPPIDLILGDFNSTSRNRGFGSILSLGYREANDHAGTYRGTWPSWFPIFGIDHVLVAPKHKILNCRSFQSSSSDHRGQFVDLQFVN